MLPYDWFNLETYLPKMHPKKLRMWATIGLLGSRQSPRDPARMFAAGWGDPGDFSNTYYELALPTIATWLDDGDATTWLHEAHTGFYPPGGIWTPDKNVFTDVIEGELLPGWEIDWKDALTNGTKGQYGPYPTAFYALCWARYVCLQYAVRAWYQARKLCALDMDLTDE